MVIRRSFELRAWVVEQMKEDLTICWRDDRGAEDRRVNATCRLEVKYRV